MSKIMPGSVLRREGAGTVLADTLLFYICDKVATIA